MKYAIGNEQRFSLETQRFLEVGPFLSEDQANHLLAEAESVCVERLKINPKDLYWTPNFQLLEAGRDVWRKGESLKSLVIGRKLSELSADVFERKYLRLGMDQFLAPSDNKCDQLFENQTLDKFFPFQGTTCAVLICLKGLEPAEGQALFCGRTGHAVFLMSDCVIPLDLLQQRHGERYLLIVYTAENTVYIHQETDPLTYSLKYLGYNFGDRLNDKLNPIVWR